MAKYCVNINPHANGDHEVHNLDSGCPHLPTVPNRLPLGEHESCRSAVREAKLVYPQSNGCGHCCPECNTATPERSA